MKYILVKNEKVIAVYDSDAALPEWRRKDVIPVASIPEKPFLEKGQRAELYYGPEQGAYWKITSPRRIYSKLKIVRALGEVGWPLKKAELEAAGLWEEWNAAQELAFDDQVFAAIYAQLSDEEKEMLEECRI